MIYAGVIATYSLAAVNLYCVESILKPGYGYSDNWDILRERGERGERGLGMGDNKMGDNKMGNGEERGHASELVRKE